MKTHLDCIPCFFRQILEGSRVAHLSAKEQKQAIDELAKAMPEMSFRASPPEIAMSVYKILRDLSRGGDPYRSIKQKSNRLALGLVKKLDDKVSRSKDGMLTALELAIAGNIIDFGVKNDLNVKAELKKILDEENRAVRKHSKFHYADFRAALKKAKDILYLADNAGEVVFDRILVKFIKKEYPDKDIYYAVKEKPVINDALVEDAKQCGIDKLVKVISNGTDAPGTILPLCSKEFRRIYKNVDMIISKGQGNFESLSEEKRPVFFLFMVKCPVVALETGCVIGSVVLLYNQKKNRYQGK